MGWTSNCLFENGYVNVSSIRVVIISAQYATLITLILLKNWYDLIFFLDVSVWTDRLKSRGWSVPNDSRKERRWQISSSHIVHVKFDEHVNCITASLQGKPCTHTDPRAFWIQPGTSPLPVSHTLPHTREHSTERSYAVRDGIRFETRSNTHKIHTRTTRLSLSDPVFGMSRHSL